VRANGSEAIQSAEVGLFDRPGTSVSIESVQDTTALLLSGEPIDEPIVGQGPFVMNTPQEIRQAIADYQSGKMGRLS
jgi:redox-sensitive bicupin YhaK (pirin superfamily)